jgi:hypothetical protein
LPPIPGFWLHPKPAITAAMNIFRLGKPAPTSKSWRRPRGARFHWNNKARK